MREIKFRAWDGEKMEYDVIVGKFGAFYVNAAASKNGLDVRDSASLTPFNTKYSDQVLVMQFTGLHDKNGVPIYEGDIVACKFDGGYVERLSWKGPPDAICEVYWDYSGFHLKAKGEQDFRYSSFEDMLRESTFGDMLMMNKSNSKVIGNVHENPELLNK